MLQNYVSFKWKMIFKDLNLSASDAHNYFVAPYVRLSHWIDLRKTLKIKYTMCSCLNFQLHC